MSVWKRLKLDKLNVKHVKKKIYVVKKILGKIFLKFFSWNLILIYILNYFYHFQPFSYYKKCAYLKEVIRRDSEQCDGVAKDLLLLILRTDYMVSKWPLITIFEFSRLRRTHVHTTHNGISSMILFSNYVKGVITINMVYCPHNWVN